MQIIGFTGFAGHGKTTAAKHLVAEHGFVRMAFADALKRDLAEMLAYVETSRPNAPTEERVQDHLDAMADTEKKKRYRLGLQWLGTNWFRSKHEDHWVNRLESKILRTNNQVNGIVVDDVRFPNEVAMIHRLGGKVFLIKREELFSSDPHESEAGIAALTVDGAFLHQTVDGLQQMIDQFMDPGCTGTVFQEQVVDTQSMSAEQLVNWGVALETGQAFAMLGTESVTHETDDVPFETTDHVEDGAILVEAAMPPAPLLAGLR